MPSATPTIVEIAVADSARKMSIRAAARTREKTSMPVLSVPIQWSALGGARLSVGNASRGEYGATALPKIAIASVSRTTADPIARRGSRRSVFATLETDTRVYGNLEQ